MLTNTKPNSKYSLLGSLTVTWLFVPLRSKLISSVKEFCLMSATGTLLFPNLLTSRDTVCYQKFWKGGILKGHHLIPVLLVFAGWQLEAQTKHAPFLHFIYLVWKLQKYLASGFVPCAKKTLAVRNEKSKCKQTRDILDEALKLYFICTYKQKPLCSDKLLKCHNPFCQSGKFFTYLLRATQREGGAGSKKYWGPEKALSPPHIRLATETAGQHCLVFNLA